MMSEAPAPRGLTPPGAVRGSRSLGPFTCLRCARLSHPRVWLRPMVREATHQSKGLTLPDGVRGCRTIGLATPDGVLVLSHTQGSVVAIYRQIFFTRHGTRPCGHSRRLNRKRSDVQRERVKVEYFHKCWNYTSSVEPQTCWSKPKDQS
ncbi:hypothetical protein V6N12_009495 [Hibiscus sabdariffa]|uniref:Uncharacterized protein n=1 Tax=Hibiscus sabdariffa TaxID=183260 RepID=A0ABR2EB55_9ROSI